MSNRPGSAATLLIALLAIAALAANFKPAVRYNVFPRNFGVVEEGKVYRSGQMSPAQFRAVHERHGFRTLVDLGSHERGTRGDRRNQRIADSLGLPRYRFDLIGDATGNPNEYVQVLRLMTDPERQPVLVYCGAGSERTSCAVILYDHIKHGTSFEEGLAGAEDFKHQPHRSPRLREVVETYGAAIIEAYRTGTALSGYEFPPEPEPVTLGTASE